MQNIRNMIEKSELIIIGETGMMNSTGWSINALVEIVEILKGVVDSKKIRIAFTPGDMSGEELEAGKRYIFFLQLLHIEDVPVYSLAADIPNAILPFSEEIITEIQNV